MQVSLTKKFGADLTNILELREENLDRSRFFFFFAMKSCRHSLCIIQIFPRLFRGICIRSTAKGDMFQYLLSYFSQHPSISSASLQALCFSANEQQLKQLREILKSASPHPSRMEDRDKQKEKTSCLESTQPLGNTGNLPQQTECF